MYYNYYTDPTTSIKNAIRNKSIGRSFKSYNPFAVSTDADYWTENFENNTVYATSQTVEDEDGNPTNQVDIGYTDDNKLRINVPPEVANKLSTYGYSSIISWLSDNPLEDDTTTTVHALDSSYRYSPVKIQVTKLPKIEGEDKDKCDSAVAGESSNEFTYKGPLDFVTEDGISNTYMEHITAEVDVTDDAITATGSDIFVTEEKPSTEMKENADLATTILDRAIQVSGPRTLSTEEPTALLNITNLVLSPYTGGADIYNKVEQSGKGKDTVMTFFYDCSGSMSGQPKRNSTSMAVALNRLCMRYPSLDIEIIYSATNAAAVIPLPVKETTLFTYNGLGDAEGLSESMKANEVRILESDFVGIFTDGGLCDGEVDKEYWSSLGVHLYALYSSRRKGKITIEELNNEYKRWEHYFHTIFFEATFENLLERVSSVIYDIRKSK